MGLAYNQPNTMVVVPDTISTSQVRRTEIAAKQMRDSYEAWISARAQGKFKDVQPEWEWIDDVEEAQRVSEHFHMMVFGVRLLQSHHFWFFCPSS